MSRNTLLVRTGLVISVDCEHETRMDHMMSVSATHPRTQVGYHKSPNFDHQTKLRPLLRNLVYNQLCAPNGCGKNCLIV